MAYQEREEYLKKKEKKKKDKLKGYLTELEILEQLKKANKGQGGGPKEFDDQDDNPLIQDED